MNELFLREFDSDEEDEEYIPDKKELEEEVVIEVKKPVNLTKVDEIWKKLKGGDTNKNNKNSEALKNMENKKLEENSKVNEINEEKIKNSSINDNSNNTNNSTTPSTSKIDDEIMKAINKHKELQNKVVKETVHFAGQKFEYTKNLTEHDVKKQKDIERKKSHSGLDNLMQMIEKKNNVNTYTKTKKDWNNYVEEKKIEKELDYNRKDGFLKRKQFIDETNLKLIENKKSIKRQKIDN